MDMQTIVMYISIIATIGYNSEAQQNFRNQVQVTSKPAQNNYVRLSEIPFENAVRAIATPPRDYVPIHEAQQDNPPPPRPQPVTNQPVTYEPQMYTNGDPVSLGYNTNSLVQHIPNTPMSFQYSTTNNYPNEVYNYLYHTTAGTNGQLQENNGYLQENNGYLQGNNAQLQGNNGYLQENNAQLHGNNEYLQENIAQLQGNNGYLHENNVQLQGNNGYLQGNKAQLQGNYVQLQGNNVYLQGNKAQLQENIGYLQGNNAQLHGNNGYLQGNNAQLHGNNGYLQGNIAQLQGNNAQLQGNNVYLKGKNEYLQGNNAYLQGNNGYQEGNNYLQQPYIPTAMSGYQTPVTFLPVMNNNFGTVLSQGIKPVSVYNNYQNLKKFNSFRPSPQYNIIDLSNYENQNKNVPSHRFRTGKSADLALPSNNNVQYLSNIQSTNGFVPSTMYVYQRSARMTSADNGQGYSMPDSKYVSGRIEYINLM